MNELERAYESTYTYMDTILTFAFTLDGRMVVKRDKYGKLDTLPWLFMGYCEEKSKMDYEDNIWIMNNRNEYKERIATFFAYHLKNSKMVILNGFFHGNSNALLDMGTLHKKIGFHQIEEMTKLNVASYISVNQCFYDLRRNKESQHIFHRIETRYIVIPDDDIRSFSELELVEFQSLKQNFEMLSTKITLGITGDDGDIMSSFISQLEYLNQSTTRKKYFE